MKKSPAEQENIKWTYWSELSFFRESVNAEETGSEMPWSNQDIPYLSVYNEHFFPAEKAPKLRCALYKESFVLD